MSPLRKEHIFVRLLLNTINDYQTASYSSRLFYGIKVNQLSELLDIEEPTQEQSLERNKMLQELFVSTRPPRDHDDDDLFKKSFC